MKTRIITGIILIPLLVLVLMLSAEVLAGAVVVVSVVGLYEFFKATGLKEKKLLCAVGYVAAVAIPFLRNYVSPELYMPLLYVFMFALFIIMLAKHETVSVNDAAMVIFGVIYIPYFLTNLLYIRQLDYGKILLWLPFVGAFLTDTCAYFSGVFLGRHKLCPKVSPKKTIEGSLGGILGCIIACLLFGLIMEKWWSVEVDYLRLGVLGLAVSIVSQVGDLTASIIKRKYGIKDYGNLFPGHGGILDRLDSVIMIAPVVYFYLLNVGIFK